MKVYIIALLMMLGVASCDSIKSIGPTENDESHSVNRIATALQNAYPSATDITLKTLEKNKLWQASFQITEDFYTSVLNEKGVFLETLRSIEDTKKLPTKILNFINHDYQNHNINGAFERLKGQENKGYKLMLSDGVGSSSLVFSTEGDLQLLAAAPTFTAYKSSSFSEISISSVGNDNNITVNGSSADFVISFISIDYDALPEAIKNYFAKVSIIGKFSSAGIQLEPDGTKTYLVSYEDAKTLSIFRFDADGNFLEQGAIKVPGEDDKPPLDLPPANLALGDILENIVAYLNENHEGWTLESGFELKNEAGETVGYSISIEVTDELSVSLIRLNFDADGNLVEPDSGSGIGFPIPPDGNNSGSGSGSNTNDLEIDPDDIPEKIVTYLNENHEGWIFMIGFENKNEAFETTGYTIAITFTNEIAVRLQFNADQEIIE